MAPSNKFLSDFQEALINDDVKRAFGALLKPFFDDFNTKFKDYISAEIDKQIKPLKKLLQAKDRTIVKLNNKVVSLEEQLDDLEQYGRRESLRFSGIPENDDVHTTDAILNICGQFCGLF